MNNQEFFTKTVTYLRGQTKPAVDEDGACVYRAVDGNKCAIGVHIPDNAYGPGMEGLEIEELLSYFPQLHPILGDVNLQLMRDMQFLHDLRFDPSRYNLWWGSRSARDNIVADQEHGGVDFEASVGKIAQAYGLEVPR